MEAFQSPNSFRFLFPWCGLKPGTLRSWFAAWKRLQSNGKGKAKPNSSTPPAIKPDGLTAPTEVAHP
jgi:hypothetical protein